MRGITQKTADTEQIALTANIPQDLSALGLLDQPHHALLYDVNESLARLSLLKNDLVVLVELNAPVLHQLQQLAFVDILKRRMATQKVGDAIPNAGGSHPEKRNSLQNTR